MQAHVLGETSTVPSSHARNSLYPTDKAIAPSNKPIAPIVMNPPMAPKNTITVGTATPRPSRRGLSTLSIKADEETPNQENNSLGGAGGRKHVNHRQYKHGPAKLKYGCDNEDHHPQSCTRQTRHEKAEGGETRLDNCNANNSGRDAADGSAGQFLEFRSPIAKEAVA